MADSDQLGICKSGRARGERMGIFRSKPSPVGRPRRVSDCRAVLANVCGDNAAECRFIFASDARGLLQAEVALPLSPPYYCSILANNNFHCGAPTGFHYEIVVVCLSVCLSFSVCRVFRLLIART